MIPKTGKKYATVDVLTAPIFSINLTYPKKAKPVETPPNHATDKKASDEGISDGKKNNVTGIIIKALKIIDQPINTSLLVFAEFFWIKTVENE